MLEDESESTETPTFRTLHQSQISQDGLLNFDPDEDCDFNFDDNDEDLSNASISSVSSSQTTSILANKRRKLTTVEESWVWKFITRIRNKDNRVTDVFCTISLCAKHFSPNTSTTNIGNHLRTSHKITKDNYKVKLGITRVPLTQKPLDEFLKSSTPHGKEKTGRLTNALIQWLVKDTQPLSTVEKESFRDFMKAVDPCYKVPCEHTVKTIIAAKFENGKEKLTNILREANSISLTLDYWTSLAQQPYLGITAHWVTKGFKLIEVLLSCENVPYPHTSEETSRTLLKTLDIYEIPKSKIICASTDNSADMIKAMRLTNIDRIPCTSHSIALVVKAGLNTIPNFVAKVKKLISHFSGLPKQRQLLEEVQIANNKPVRTVISPTETRWNSFYLALERLVDIHSSICILAAKLDGNDSEEESREVSRNLNEKKLTDNEISFAKDLIEILKPFEEATRIVGGSKYATLCIMVPVIKNLENRFGTGAESMDTLVDSVKKAICKKMESRWNDQNTSYYTLGNRAMFFDPRFKDLRFLNFDQMNTVTCFIKNIYNSRVREIETNTSTISQVEESNNDILSSFFANTPLEQNVNAKDELTRYNEIPTQKINIKSDPFEWWRIHSLQFPILASMARDYLAIPATSVPSERLFSDAGKVNFKNSFMHTLLITLRSIREPYRC
jgi:zinc finger BED domain-containing protein 1 (E3 SUMO-protein ligase ZBED1)